MKKLWRHFSHLGVNSAMGFETARRVILFNRLAVTLFCIVLGMRILVMALQVQEFSSSAILPIVAIFTLLGLPYINKLGYYKINSFSFTIIAPVCALLFSVNAQTSNDVVNIAHYIYPRIFIMSLLVLPLILIDSRDKWLLGIAIFVNITCVLSFDTAVKYLGVPFDPATVDFSNYERIAKMMLLPMAVMILAFLFLNNLNRKYETQIIRLNEGLQSKNNDLKHYNEEIVTQRDMISSKNLLLEKTYTQIANIHKDLTDSILYAKNIQNAVLDTEKLPDSFFSESFIFFKAKLHVSGDFYYSKRMQINAKDCLIVASVDCTGHGVPGGFLSMLGISLLNEILENEFIINAAEILNHLRARIKGVLNQRGKHTDQKDGMDMSLCIYYPESKQAVFSGARNPLCIVHTDESIHVLKGDRQPIGVYERETPFTNHTIQLSEGDMLYMYSDGLQDQFGGEQGKKLKSSNLKKLLVSISKQRCPDQKLAIETFIKEWTHPAQKKPFEQVDDIVLIGMRV